MRIAGIRFLGLCLGLGAAISLVIGSLYGLLSAATVPYGIATAMFLVGVIALVAGLLAATEPPEGWARPRGGASSGRRSLLGRGAAEHPSLEGVSSVSLAMWALIVGGGLIVLSFVLFEIAR